MPPPSVQGHCETQWHPVVGSGPPPPDELPEPAVSAIRARSAAVGRAEIGYRPVAAIAGQIGITLTVSGQRQPAATSAAFHGAFMRDKQKPQSSKTPFERFESLMKKLVAVPKEEAKHVIRAVPPTKKKHRRK